MNIVYYFIINFFSLVSIALVEMRREIFACSFFLFYIFCQQVEVKNGDTYNGNLISCDKFMNIKLSDVTLTKAVCNYQFTLHILLQDGNKFFQMPEILIKGNSLKCFRLQEIVLDKAYEETPKYQHTYHSKKNFQLKGKPRRGKSDSGFEPQRGSKIRSRGPN